MKGVSPRLILGIILTVVIILGLAFLISLLSVSFMRAQNLRFFADLTTGITKAVTKHEVSMAGLELQGDNTRQYHILFIDKDTAEDLQITPECKLDRFSVFLLERCKDVGCICLFEHVPSVGAEGKESEKDDLCIGLSCDDLTTVTLLSVETSTRIIVISSFFLEKPTIYYADTKEGVFESSRDMLTNFCLSGDQLKILDCKSLAEIGLIRSDGEFMPVKMKLKNKGTVYFAGFGAMNGKLILKFFKIEQPYDEERNVYLDELYITNISMKVE